MSFVQPQWGPVAASSPIVPEHPSGAAIDFEGGENCADVLIEVGGVSVTEEYMADGGSRVSELVLKDAPLVVLSMMPSSQELALANDQLGLPANTLSTDSNDTGKPLVFIMVGNYKLPLGSTLVEKGPSPCTYSYHFPNLTLVLGLPPNLHVDDVDAFDFILNTYGRYVDRVGGTVTVAPSPAQSERLSQRIASRITAAAGLAASGIIASGKFAAAGISRGAGLIVERTRPRAQPLRVSEATRGRIERTRVMTKGAVVLSSGLASSLVGIAAIAGNNVGRHVVRHVLPEGAGESPLLAGALEVGSAVVGSGLVLFNAVGDAGRDVLTMSCDGASQIVTRRLGAEAGEAATSGFGVVKNVYDVRQFSKQIGVKGFAKSVAKEGVKELGNAHK